MKNIKFNVVLIISFLTLVIYIWFDGGKKYDEIEKSGNTLIVKFEKFEKYPKRNSYMFDFYVNQNRISKIKEKVPENFSFNVGKFYYAKYLEKYPDLILIEFDREVIDTSEILRAGFSKEDLPDGSDMSTQR